jgi:hypothetical protein
MVPMRSELLYRFPFRLRQKQTLLGHAMDASSSNDALFGKVGFS